MQSRILYSCASLAYFYGNWFLISVRISFSMRKGMYAARVHTYKKISKEILNSAMRLLLDRCLKSNSKIWISINSRGTTHRRPTVPTNQPTDSRFFHFSLCDLCVSISNKTSFKGFWARLSMWQTELTNKQLQCI